MAPAGGQRPAGVLNTEATLDPPSIDVTVGIPTRNRSELLDKSIASVLGQSYRDFTLLVSDNASDDDTAHVVASHRDPRLVYRPLQHMVSMHDNFNRLIELADTEFVVLLCDDDELHPDHLALTLDALKRWPTAGVAHTGCVLVDAAGKTLDPHARLVKTKRPSAFEPGGQFLERSMRSGWMACFASAAFRRAALVRAGGLREDDGVIDDLALLMRIATDWDFAYVNKPLAVMTAHTGAASSALGAFMPGGFRASHSLADMLYGLRRRFLAEADLPEPEARRLARIAKQTHRRDRVRHLSMRATTGDGVAVVFRALTEEVRRDPRLALEPMTWRFVAGQLGGRRVRDALRRALAQTSPS